MLSLQVVMGAIALQSLWLTFVWLHNGGWKVHYAFFRISYTPFVICYLPCLCVMCFGFFKKHDLPVDCLQLQTEPTPQTKLHFLYMLGDWGDDNTSDPSCFNPTTPILPVSNPSIGRTAPVSIRVKLCSCTFIDGWQTRVSPRTWRLLHQPDLNFSNMSLCGVAYNLFFYS